VLYGVPWASCAIQGNVVDKATNQPIPGIEVKIALPAHMSQSFPDAGKWKITTDAKGDYKLSNTMQMDSIPLVATDIDGEKNGLYRPDTIYVNFSNAKHIGGGSGWFQGELVATANFKLEAQEPDNE
jgi:putative lipoprotein (rSAM/lipoprotein system)